MGLKIKKTKDGYILYDVEKLICTSASSIEQAFQKFNDEIEERSSIFESYDIKKENTKKFQFMNYGAHYSKFVILIITLGILIFSYLFISRTIDEKKDLFMEYAKFIPGEIKRNILYTPHGTQRCFICIFDEVLSVVEKDLDSPAAKKVLPNIKNKLERISSRLEVND